MNKFIHVETKEIVRIISDEGNFYILNNGMKIDKQLFAQKYAPFNSEQIIDAETFLNQTSIQINTPKQQIENVKSDSIDPIEFLNSGLSNIKGIDDLIKLDLSKYIDVPESQRVIVKDLSTLKQNEQIKILDNEKQKLLEKYKNMGTNIQANFIDENDDKAINQFINMGKPQPKVVLNENGLTETQEIFRQQQIELTGIDPYEEKINKYKISKNYQNTETVKTSNNIEKENNYPDESNMAQINNIEQIQQDPTIAIFKKFKRNYDVTIKLEIKDKISKPDFIKIMSDGFESDILQFYTDEIFKIFIDNSKNIKKEIYNQLYKIVYGCLPGENEEKKQKQKKNTTQNRKIKSNKNNNLKEKDSTKLKTSKQSNKNNDLKDSTKLKINEQ